MSQVFFGARRILCGRGEYEIEVSLNEAEARWYSDNDPLVFGRVRKVRFPIALAKALAYSVLPEVIARERQDAASEECERIVALPWWKRLRLNAPDVPSYKAIANEFELVAP